MDTVEHCDMEKKLHRKENVTGGGESECVSRQRFQTISKYHHHHHHHHGPKKKVKENFAENHEQRSKEQFFGIANKTHCICSSAQRKKSNTHERQEQDKARSASEEKI
jgi:hypothetical protein